MIGPRSVIILRVIAVLLGLVVIIAAGLGIAYAVKKKHILLVVTNTAPETGIATLSEILLKRKDGSTTFSGTTVADDGTNINVTMTKAAAHHMQSGSDIRYWLIAFDDKIVAASRPGSSSEANGGIFSFLAYDPPSGTEWTADPGGSRTRSFSHSWY